MKSMKEFLGEAKEIAKGDSVKVKNAKKYDALARGEVTGTVVGKMDKDTYMVKVGSGQMNVDKADLVKESLTEAKYEVEVAVRDAMKANGIAKDMFRGSYTQNGSNSFVFKKEDDYEDFKDELESQNIELLESQINESKSKTTKENPIVTIWESAKSKGYPSQGIMGHMNLLVAKSIYRFDIEGLAEKLFEVGVGKRVKAGRVYLELSDATFKEMK